MVSETRQIARIRKLECPLRPALYSKKHHWGQLTDKMGFDVRNHHLVCNHSKASDVEKEALLKRYNIGILDLPKILQLDPAIAALNPKEGDVIKIERISKTAGKTEYYRMVIES